MIDKLRITYKLRYDMNINEEVKSLETIKLVTSIKSTFINLAMNGKNEFEIQV